ncbi:Fc receptor-like protein 5 isoform X2 [Tachysurus vachellii]|uniref:Fc receptor-like protein 5 isoform X2 n=1 Tax=Tachysurus vachellii TaxID=175792 RepID=UPI00296B587D|nr:Fc receptor-like protein 5 isoform X2 [Tachysurus vachellii]
MELSPLPVMLLLISLIPETHAEGQPKAVLSIKPDKHVYSGETITLRCDIEGGDTKWTYIWFKNNSSLQTEEGKGKQNKDSKKQEFRIKYVKDTDSGNYTCKGHIGNSQSSQSDAVTLNVSERPQTVLSVSPQRWLTEGDSVTLSCKVTNSSTDWTFSWYRDVLNRSNPSNIKTNPVLLTDSSRGSGGKYTLSPASVKHTGVYRCRGKRGEQHLYTKYSSGKPLWITGESPPVSLIINPSRTQHFTNDSLSLSCEDQSKSTGWTVRRYAHSKNESDCSHWGSVTGSTCNISFLSTSYTGVYWCESESGENSNPVNITVHDGDVILESPVHPVTEGHPLTLRCLYRTPNASNLTADFYKNGSVLQNQTTGEMIIQTVLKSDEGFYLCKHPQSRKSLKSWVSVRRSRSTSTTLAFILSLAFLIILLIFLLGFCKIKKEKQKTNQTSEQNQSRAGVEDTQSGNTPLQAGSDNIYDIVEQADMRGTGEAAAESNETTYVQVMKKKKANRNNDLDGELSGSDVTYAQLELKPKKLSMREKEKASVDADSLYSAVKLNNKSPSPSRHISG